MKWTLGPVGSRWLLVAGDRAAIRATGPHDTADCPSGALSNQCWGGTGAGGCCGGGGSRQSAPYFRSSPTLRHRARSGWAPVGALWMLVRKGDLPLLLCVFDGVSGRGALQTECDRALCKPALACGRPLPTVSQQPSWKPTLGAVCPSPWAGAGSVLRDASLPTGPREVLGSSIKLTEEASQTRKK